MIELLIIVIIWLVLELLGWRDGRADPPESGWM
jgi:hypothetical protein